MFSYVDSTADFQAVILSEPGGKCFLPVPPLEPDALAGPISKFLSFRFPSPKMGPEVCGPGTLVLNQPKKGKHMSTLLKLTFAFAVLAFGLLQTAGTAAAADISGDWAFEVEISGNQGTPGFTFKQDGEKLSGKYKGQFGEADLSGTVKENNIEFSFELEGGGKVTYKGTIDKDSMKGTCDYAGQAEGTWTGKKK